MLIIKLIKLLL